MDKLVIIDYGMGNLRSVQKAFERINIPAIISRDKNVIEDAGKLVLPGVGHFRNGMSNLQDLGFVDIINKKVLFEKTPILGICLGMQLFTKYSEEGDCPGLGFIDAVTIKFSFPDKKIKIPHMGWNNVFFKNEDQCKGKNIVDESFYFVHSYHVNCKNNEEVIGETDYGYTFTSAVRKDNITGFQFHPEKSFNAGLHLLRKFCS